MSNTQLPAAFIALAIVLSFFGLGENTGLALAAAAVLGFGWILLWPSGAPPMLFYVFAFQWLQASLAIFLAQMAGESLDDYSPLGGSDALATQLSLAGLVALALGIRLGAGRLRGSAFAAPARALATSGAQSKWIALYLAAWAIAMAALWLTRAAPALSQLFFALAQLKWAFYLMLTAVTFAQRDSNKLAWFAIAAGEFALAFGDYFSSFQSVLIFTIMGLLGAQLKFNATRIIMLASTAALMLTISLYWTAVKGDYRAYVSGGERSQVVARDRGERTQQLAELLSEVDGEDLTYAASDLMQRITYVGYFGKTLDYVPRAAPHENGALFADAALRPFQPRLLFPDKPALDDSAITNRYTGLQVADAGSGTSISLGYMAESYVDFGRFGMMAPIFVIGALIGLLYRWTANNKATTPFLGVCLACAIVYSFRGFETSLAKMMGAWVAAAIVIWGILFVTRLGFLPWIASPSNAQTRQAHQA